MYNFKFLWPWETQNRVKGRKDSKLCPNVNSWPFILSSFILAETREPDDIATGLKTIALLIPWVRTHASTKTNDPLAQLLITRHSNNFKICLPCSPSTIRPELCVSFFSSGRNLSSRNYQELNASLTITANKKQANLLWLQRRTFVLRLSVDGFLCWSDIWINLLTVWEYFDKVPTGVGWRDLIKRHAEIKSKNFYSRNNLHKYTNTNIQKFEISKFFLFF